MSRFSQAKFLEEQLRLLAEQFGRDKVQRALAKVSPSEDESEKEPVSNDRSQRPRFDLQAVMEGLKVRDPKRHDSLLEFRNRLEERNILPESEDLRQFAQVAGLKELPGKSRRDMIPRLLSFLATIPGEKLYQALKVAEGISAEERNKGFSVLADKLLGDR